LQDGKARVILADNSLLGGGVNALDWLPDGRILFGLYKGSTNESDLWSVSLDSNGVVAGKPLRLTNTTGVYVVGLSSSADGKRLATVFARQPFALFVANLTRTGDKLEKPLRLTNELLEQLARLVGARQ
jgi:dipeptidyl aminopeptidase/acylaminoacyl peptidase